MNEWAIETRQLSKYYGDVKALDGLTLKAPKGSVYGYLGRNGAGKSTTLKVLLGLARATSGEAHVLGERVRPENLAILERTAYVGENKPLYEWMSAEQMVRFTRGFYKSWSDEAARRYAEMLEIPMRRKIKKLSKGNRTKVSLLLALAQGAELLMLDEPTSGLDPVYLDDVLRTLVEHHVNEGRTVFFSSHDLSEVEQIAEWVGIIDNGKMLLEARLDDIRENFRTVIASGNGLPETGENIASVTRDGNFRKYVLARGGESFAASLEQQGAAVLEVKAMSLREVFLALLRKESANVSVEVLA
jgi:ABC-2 type transport system ATP-binding protein